MGRYYDGDIEGKFWFAVQDSDDGEFFGAEETNSNYINYCVLSKNKDKVFKGVDECKKQLGEWLTIFDNYFHEDSAYSDLKIEDFIANNHYKVNAKDYKVKIIWYARLMMGIKMKDFFKDNPDNNLYFEAEL
ncbi:hypothetical protein [uncultured Gammaproteobacteria bacterium]|jgi:hypothetical protein|nr:hypothetical protein [uncultured Gammaproteobacteria bacterium]CAC9523747.1 hypothetical protein [uncultured Gammaproteobacteria bacterium]CAC9987753.1 hypothetical protein [uncultured Gammaproteobacteria bacterium]VVH58312.1 hypothetical protein BAZOLSSOX_872 [uncultured Gammaproteobacteria bacterium]